MGHRLGRDRNVLFGFGKGCKLLSLRFSMTESGRCGRKYLGKCGCERGSTATIYPRCETCREQGEMLPSLALPLASQVSIPPSDAKRELVAVLVEIR